MMQHFYNFLLDLVELQTSRSKNIPNQRNPTSIPSRLSFKSSLASLFSFRKSRKETLKLPSPGQKGWVKLKSWDSSLVIWSQRPVACLCSECWMFVLRIWIQIVTKETGFTSHGDKVLVEPWKLGSLEIQLLTNCTDPRWCTWWMMG